MIDVSNPDPRFQPRDIPLIADAPKLDVLVVEDDEADAYLIRTALRRNPKISRVVFAGDGFEALHIVEAGEQSIRTWRSSISICPARTV